MDSIRSIEGNYTGTSNTYMTVLEGVHKYFPGNKIVSAMGCHLYKDHLDPISGRGDGLTEAAIVADMADVIIMCLGLDNTLEGEQGDPSNAYPGGDKPDNLLPKPQRESSTLFLNNP